LVEHGPYHIEVSRIWRDRNEMTKAIEKVHIKKLTLLWKSIISVEQCACDDGHWDRFNTKPKTTIEVKDIGCITVLADYNRFRDKWVEFADSWLLLDVMKKDN